MKTKTSTFLIFFFITVHASLAQKSVQLDSPNKNIHFELRTGTLSPVYSIAFKNEILIENSPLSLELDDGLFSHDIKIKNPSFTVVTDTYQLVTGKTRFVTSKCNQAVIPLMEKDPPFRTIILTVRAFNDGIAFRYEFPNRGNRSEFTLYNEGTTFNITGNPKVLALFLPSYQTSHEGLYTHVNYLDLDEKHLIDMPVLFEFPNSIYMAVTEASVRNYAGMYLWKEEGTLYGKLSPNLQKPQIKVEARLPHHSPWRVFMISDRMGSLVESNILTNLNEPCKINDTSWIKPGKTTFTWWNGNMVPDTNFSPGNNFLTNKYYIDFASANTLQYHAIYGYAEQPWYVDNGFDFGTPGPDADVTRSIKPLDMKAICDYAENKGVGIYVWVNWKALYARLDSALEQFEKWGIRGMMVDFMDRDDQEMINIQEEILSRAADHKMFVQFHGSCKPSGMHRTYPNEFTREGTLNYEVYKWDTIIDADHDISIPFTRMLAGPADYHLGGFRAVPRSQFKIHFTHPLVTSTRCHMLAMYVVLESYLSMVADIPEAYTNQPGFEFIQSVPTVWDETKVPDAVVNEYIVVARKKNGVWYAGALNNSTSRMLDLSLDFLGDGKFNAIIWHDAEDARVNPNHLVKEERIVSGKDTIRLPLAVDGGAVISFKKVSL
jgi:alpha-glucosidase